MSKDEIMNLVSEIIQVDKDSLAEYSKELEEIGATYYWNPERGGLSIIINDSGEKLVATSAVNFDMHYRDFCNGRRN